MNMYQIHQILRQFRRGFRAFFSALTDHDFGVILAAPSEMLLVVLQDRYGYTRLQAKAAWNEFVLRYVDGHVSKDRVELDCISVCTACLTSGQHEIAPGKIYREIRCV